MDLEYSGVMYIWTPEGFERGGAGPWFDTFEEAEEMRRNLELMGREELGDGFLWEVHVIARRKNVLRRGHRRGKKKPW